MGPNSFRNLTYLTVLLVVGALIYLIYSASKNRNRLNPSIDNTTLSGYGDSLSSMVGSSVAALPIDSVKNTIDGALIDGTSSLAAAPAALAKGASAVASEVKEVVTSEPISTTSTGPDDGIASSEKGKANVPKKGVTVTSKGVTAPTKPQAKFDPGKGGDFLAIAGSFASKDNAQGLVAKLKKMGFTKAEAVKLENSPNVYVVAGAYDFKGGADAAVRTLKANKVESYVKKLSGDIYHAAPTAAPAPAPKAPAKPALGTKGTSAS
jgi:hypothetical protein